MKDCCYQCAKRTPGCHGRNEDGSYKCREWKQREEARKKQRPKAMAEMDYLAYKFQSRVRHETLRKYHRT